MVALNALRRMSYPELVELETRIGSIKEEKRGEERVLARQEAEKMAKARGFTLKEIMTARVRRSPTIHVNPENPKQTWNNWGRPPKWFKDQKKARAKEAA